MSEKKLTAAEIKAACEAQWADSRMAYYDKGAIWSLKSFGLFHQPGRSMAPSNSHAGLAKFRRHWGPPPPAYDASIKCPRDVARRYRENCPRNWRQLVAGYGKTDAFKPLDTKELAALPPIPGLVSIEHDGPAPIAAPVALPAAPAPIAADDMSDSDLAAAADSVLADVCREIAEFAANVAADHAADARAAETGRQRPTAAAAPIIRAKAAAPASGRRARKPAPIPAMPWRDRPAPVFRRAAPIGLR